MSSTGKSAGEVTPVKKDSQSSNRVSKVSENINPNVKSPNLRFSKSPALKSATKSATVRKPDLIPSPSPRNKIRERKFVVVAKKTKKSNTEKEKEKSCCGKCKIKVGGNAQKCLCVAYETLRASQEDFFKNRPAIDDQLSAEEEEEEVKKIENPKIGIGYEGKFEEIEVGNCAIKRRRDKKVMEKDIVVCEEEAKAVVVGSGKVMNLVKAFEKLLSTPTNDEKETELNSNDNVVSSLSASSSSFCPSDFLVTSQSLGLSSSVDSTQRGSISSRRTSGGGGRRRNGRRNSSESCGNFGGRQWKRRHLKATSLKPFKLRTEQRGKNKEEEFMKKVEQIMIEEEKKRIPIAQGLPWTTDEPQCLAKPPVKEITRPIDLVLHSDVRAVDRAEFDHQVAEKMSLIDQYHMERERQQKMEEEEEIRRLRKELVPKAQPMPYFDRPFIPKRSQKNPTIPKKPKFIVMAHPPQHKKIKCSTSNSTMSSWSDVCVFKP